jgi:hypothetical protein
LTRNQKKYIQKSKCFSFEVGLDSGELSTNKTDRHDITEILMKVALNTINKPIQTFISL